MAVGQSPLLKSRHPVAVCCSVLYCVAACYSMLQCVANGSWITAVVEE